MSNSDSTPTLKDLSDVVKGFVSKPVRTFFPTTLVTLFYTYVGYSALLEIKEKSPTEGVVYFDGIEVGKCYIEGQAFVYKPKVE